MLKKSSFFTEFAEMPLKEFAPATSPWLFRGCMTVVRCTLAEETVKSNCLQLSQGWACHSYEKIEEQAKLKTLIELYGEDTEQFLYDNLYHKEESFVYISFNNPVDLEKIDYYRTLFDDRLEIETGSAAVLEKLLLGDIDEETLIVPP